MRTPAPSVVSIALLMLVAALLYRAVLERAFDTRIRSLEDSRYRFVHTENHQPQKP